MKAIPGTKLLQQSLRCGIMRLRSMALSAALLLPVLVFWARERLHQNTDRSSAGAIVHHARRLYVALSSDLADAQYSSLAPLTVYVWAQLGVTSLVFLPAHNTSSRVAAFVRGSISRFGGEVSFTSTRPGDVQATLLQNVRLAAFQHASLAPKDLLLTTDADIWPLSPRFWRSILGGLGNKVLVYNGPFYRARRRRGDNNFAALSVLGAPVWRWRSMYAKWCNATHVAPFGAGEVQRTVWQLLDAGLQSRTPAVWGRDKSKHGSQWNWDQVLAGKWLDAAAACPQRCVLNDQVVRLDRLDSAKKWSEASKLSAHTLPYTDAHLVYPITDDGAFLKLRGLWHAVFNNTRVIDEYRRDLLEALRADAVAARGALRKRSKQLGGS